MRILIYGINYAPELTGIGKYTAEMSNWLAERGHHVHVVTAPPYYPAWRVSSGHRNAYRIERNPGRPTIYRCPLYVPERPTGINRVGHLVSFVLSSLPVMLRQAFWQPDIIFTVEPTFFGAPVALLTARAAGAASWLHIQDFEVDAAFDLGLLPAKGTIHDVALTLERVFTQAFTRVSTISEKMVERVEQRDIPPAHAILFPNWVDVDTIHPQTEGELANNYFRRELHLENKIILLYSGNMGSKQGLEVLAPLARTFEDDPRVHFIFCGNGAFRPQLEALVANHGNVTMLPLQPLARLNDLLNAADIHLLPQRAGAADLVMPSKLTGMLSSGRPIIATSDPGTQVAHVVGGYAVGGEDACGLVAPAEDTPALHNAAAVLIEDAPLRRRLGEAARRYAVQHLGKQRVLEEFEHDLMDLL